jgi:hypothetical protein
MDLYPPSDEGWEARSLLDPVEGVNPNNWTQITNWVSDDTVKYGYGFCATRTIEWLHCKLQTRPLVREEAPQKQDRKFETATFRQEVKSDC